MSVFSELNQANNRNGDLLTEISRLQAENAKLRAELEQVESENEHHIRLAFEAAEQAQDLLNGRHNADTDAYKAFCILNAAISRDRAADRSGK